MKNRMKTKIKRLAALVIATVLTITNIPVDGLIISAEAKEDYILKNEYIKAEVSEENGGFSITTIKGDKVNKSDNYKYLLFHNGVDDTSFTSFQVTRGDITKEYIFGEDYEGSSKVELSKGSDDIKAVWSVDDITFTQTINVINSGSTEHGMVYISYSAQNHGEPADIKVRVLMDTAFDNQDYAYYNLGSQNVIERETTLGEDGYNKTFYGYDNLRSPGITSYFVNASVDNRECKPYQTIFAHWNNIASTVFDYTTDSSMTFTNPHNKKYLTADSAVALYYNMGTVEENTATVALNYGIYSNEHVSYTDTAAVNVTAPDVLELTADKSAYTDDGYFTIKTNIQNIGVREYDRVRVAVYCTSAITPLNDKGEDVGATYDNPYYVDYSNFSSGQRQTTEWKFKATPQADGQYATVHFKVYNISDDVTMSTQALLAENFMGEGTTYILCPGSKNEIPKIQFTGSSPEVLYSEGIRNLTITGSNFSMLMNTSEYQVRIKRVDGHSVYGKESIEIPKNNVKIDSEKNTITVVFTDEDPGTLPTGQYELYFHYNQSEKEDLIAPALKFQVKDEPKYRNDTYGILVAQESEIDSREYVIVEYKSEEEYKQALADDNSLEDRSLLEFRGIFTKKTSTSSSRNSIIYTGISLNDSDNVMTLNNCLDIKEGIVTITQTNDGVTVDFDAKIEITGEGTTVWKGVCALTELENGREYGLIPYKENGERKDFNKQTITLLWPSIGQAAHNLLGLLMDFKYAELGKIEHSNAKDTRVVAFGAALDLSFVSNKAGELDSTTALSKAYENAVLHSSLGGSELRKINKSVPYNSDTVNTDADEDDDKAEFKGSIQVDDVLFGGKYLGVCFSIGIGVPSYVEGMPEIEGLLTVRTVGNWEIGLSGECDFEMFCLEAEVEIKSNGKFVVPNKFRLFLGNFTPGVNVDGVGVLWLQGAGGGIDNLYDTIFLTDSIPPLKLLIEAQFSIMQVISARAALELSLRGISVELKDGKVANNIKVLDSAKLVFEWYPQFYFCTAVNMNIMDAIVGGGYIVVEGNGFFEFFIRAGLLFPESVPVVGGMEVGSVGLGANSDKLWGKVSVIGVSVGVVYYWGDSIQWSGGEEAEPTYPELVGMSAKSLGDTPVYYDEETGRTLYVHVGTNVNQRVQTQTVDSFDTNNEQTSFMDANTVLWRDTMEGLSFSSLQTLTDKSAHLLSLGHKTKDEILILQWQAGSIEEAKVQSETIVVKDDETGELFEIKAVDHSRIVEEQTDANANLSYDAETQTAMFAITFTDESSFDRKWRITSEQVCDAILYDLDEMPELAEETAITDISNQKMTVNFKGTKLDSYDKVLFTAVPKDESKDAILLYQKTEPIAEGEIVFDLPYNLESGEYTLEISASDSESNYYSCVSKDFVYENPNQPVKPEQVSAAAAGNYRMEVQIDKPEGNFDGYRINVYDEDGNIVDGLQRLLYTTDGMSVQYDEDGNILPGGDAKDKVSFTVGGQYSYEDETTGNSKLVGLEANSRYTAGISTWNVSENGELIYSEETKTQALMIPEITQTSITITANAQAVYIDDERTDSAGEKIEFSTPYYNTDALKLTIQADDVIEGNWKLDGGYRSMDKGSFRNTDEITLNLSGIASGAHILEIYGTNSNKDVVRETYTFGIDTEGPRLLIASPISGATFDSNGKVLIQGITDAGTKLSITNKISGSKYLSEYEVNVDENGYFEKEITVDVNAVSCDLLFEAKDALGNVTQREIQLLNQAMGKIDSVDLYVGDTVITNTKLTAGGSYRLSLKANLTDGRVIDLTGSNYVEWNTSFMEGSGELLEGGSLKELSTDKEAVGMVSAVFRGNYSGSYSAVAVFGAGGVNNLENGNGAMTFEDTAYYTSSEVYVSPKVYYNGELLQKGVDYTVYYENNIQVTTKDKKAKVSITGQGDYSGSLDGEFDIIYLDSEGTYDIVSELGNNNWYVGDVQLVAKDGYQLSEESQLSGYSSSITISEEGNQTKEFYVKRISDGALSDKVTHEVKVDKTAPEGSITLDNKNWSEFVLNRIINKYHLSDYRYILQAVDAISGVASMQYAIFEDESFDTVEELLSAGPVWEDFDILNPPVAKEGTTQRIYAKFMDHAGNVKYVGSDGVLRDTTPPVITNLHMKEDESLEALQADIAFSVNEPCTYYYAVVQQGENAPTKEQLLLQSVTNGVAGKGVIAEEDINKEVRLTVNGLQKDTYYLVYMMAEDTAISIATGEKNPNQSEVIVSAKAVKTQIIPVDMTDADISVTMTESVEYTGLEQRPEMVVKYGELVLEEGVDYTVSWENNIAVTVTNKAKAIVTGIGNYTGERTLEFSIVYLNANGKYEILGEKGSDNWYKNASIIPAFGYEMIPAAEIEEGENQISFVIRRISDHALSDTISLSVKVDATKPTGSIRIAGKNWSDFREEADIIETRKKEKLVILAMDTLSGIAKIEYATNDMSTSLLRAKPTFDSTEELANANLEWKEYTPGEEVEISTVEEVIVYVRITDKAGNVEYLNSDYMHYNPLSTGCTYTVDTDTTTAKPGDTIDFTVYMQQTGKQNSLQATIVIPNGLTFVAGSGEIVDGLANTLNWTGEADGVEWSEETMLLKGSGAASFTGTDEIALMTFKCTVDSDAAEKNYEVKLENCDAGNENNDSKTVTSISAFFDVVKPHVHVFDKEVVSQEYLKSKVNCTTPATYYKSCECGIKGTETFTVGIALGHDYSVEMVDDAHLKAIATKCTEYNQYWLECSRCGENAKNDGQAADKYFISEIAGAHSFTEKVEDDAHYVAGTGMDCQNVKEYYYDCKYCDTIGTSTWSGNVCGPHDFSETWESDSTGHWHKCLISGCMVTDSFAAHTPDHEGHATEEYSIKCTECQYVIEVQLNHSHNTKLVEAQKATCTEDGSKAYYVCEGCGTWFEDEAGTVEITDHSEIIIPATGHRFVPADCTTPKTCTNCGHTEGNALGHDWTEEWSQDADTHWHACSRCQDKADEANHIPDREEATEQDPIKCLVCGYIIAPELEHTHNLLKVDAKDASCTENGNIAYYVCEDCDKIFADEEGTVELTMEDTVILAIGHKYEWIIDIEPTDTENGMKHEECANCHDKKEPVEIPALGEESTSEEPTSEEPTSEEPTSEEPTSEEPTSEEPTSEEPTSEEPTTEEPTTSQNTEKPQTGDSNMADTWKVILFLSGMGAAGVILYKRKNKHTSN